MIRPVLACLALAVLGTSAAADNPAGTRDDPLALNNYRCMDFGLVQVAFADGRAIVLMDGNSHSLPYVTEIGDDVHLYADARTVMVLGEDVFIGPRTERGGAIVRPTRQCTWEAKAEL